MNILTAKHHGYDDQAFVTKAHAHETTARQMRKLAAALGLESGSYEVCSNKAGIASSGEVTLHGERIYVQAGCLCGLLVRSCKSRHDFTGGNNNWLNPSELEFPERLAQKIRPIMGDSPQHLINVMHPEES